MSQLIYNDIKQMIKEVISSQTPTDTLIGTIVSTDPMQVEIDGNSEYYPSSCYVVPESLTDKQIEISYEGTNEVTGDGLSFSGAMTINNGLKVGDSVVIIQCQRGQKLLILDRLPE